MVDPVLRELERATAERPDDAAAWLRLARALARAERLDAAASAYARVRAIDPSDAEARAAADPGAEAIAALRPVARLATGNIATRAASFSPDGGLLALGGTSRAVLVFDTASWDDVLALPGHADSIHHVAFSPDGTHLAASSRGGATTLWELATDRRSAVRRDPDDPPVWVNDLAWSPEGDALLAARDAGGVLVWDRPSATSIARLRLDEGDGDLEIAATGVATARVPGEHEGERAAVGWHDGSVTIHALPGGERLVRVDAHASPVAALAWGRDGARLLTAGHDGTVLVHDVAGGLAASARLDPFADQRDVAHETPTGVGRRRAREAAREEAWADGVVLGVAWSPHERWVAALSSWGEVRVVPLEPGAEAPAPAAVLPGSAGLWGAVAWGADASLLVHAQGQIVVYGLPSVPDGPGIGFDLPPGIDADVPPPTDVGFA